MQRHEIRSNYTKYYHHETDKQWSEWRNRDWHRFDVEYGKLLDQRKELMLSKWGQAIKTRVEKLRASTEFKNLEQDWKEQTKYSRHLDRVEKWEDLKEAWIYDIKESDIPDDFYDGNFVHQVVKLMNFIKDIDNGELKGFFEYLLSATDR